MFGLAAEDLCSALCSMRDKGEDVFLQVSLSEVHGGKVRDLVGGVECVLREDDAGQVCASVHVRCLKH